jgi:hypothetical protein
MHRFNTKRLQLLTVALTCLGIGAGASAIAAADASSTPSSHTQALRSPQALRGTRVRALLRRTVEGNLVVSTKSGFVNVSVARGRVQAVNGDQLTLVEGTAKQSYRTVTLTLPANVKVRDDRQTSTLSQLTSGQRAVVIIGPKRGLVLAHTPKNP